MESYIQNAIFLLCVNQKRNGRQYFYNIVPNVFFFDWESDLLMTNAEDYIFEYEIKNSRSDFLNDFSNKSKKHKALSSRNGDIPNYFYFVVKEGEIDIDEVPEYAGLYTFRITTNSDGRYDIYFQCAKIAPRLHDLRSSIKDEKTILQSLYFKYWRNRIGEAIVPK